MQEIAKDMGLQMSDDNFLSLNNFSGKLQILEIRNTQDLEYLEKEWGGRSPAHLVVVCNINNLEDKIVEVYRKGQIFSISFLENTESIKKAADKLKDIPIFIVNNQKEAYDFIKQFHSNPVTTVSKAINGESVLLRFLEGSPT